MTETVWTDGLMTNRFVLFTTCFASLSESLWQKLSLLLHLNNFVMEWFRLMTFCPWEICPTLKYGLFKFRNRHLTVQNVINLDHSGKKWHSPGPFQSSSSSSSSYCHEFYFLQPGGRISLNWTVLDRMSPNGRFWTEGHLNRPFWTEWHLNRPFWTEWHLNGPFCSSWSSSFLVHSEFWVKKIVGFWDKKKVEKFLEKCV